MWIRRTIRFALNMMLAIYMAVTLVIVGPVFADFHGYAVVSASMTPELPVGCAVYVKSEKFDEIKVGDVITYVINQDLDKVTHRVTEIDKENETFITKGDANKDPDTKPVHYNNVIGTVRWHIPYAGYLLSFISVATGKIVAICVLFAIMLLSNLFEDLCKVPAKKTESLKEANGKEETA